MPASDPSGIMAQTPQGTITDMGRYPDEGRHHHMDKNAEYRAHARECQRLAYDTSSVNDRRSWLSLSAAWLQMVPFTDRQPSEPDRKN